MCDGVGWEGVSIFIGYIHVYIYTHTGGQSEATWTLGDHQESSEVATEFRVSWEFPQWEYDA